MRERSDPASATGRQRTEGRRVGPTNPFIEFKLGDAEQSIPARFEQQVARYPERRAVKTATRDLTYAELNRLANRVAHAILARRGEGAEPIALLLGHDAPMITAIFGVLKSGKLYAPLDPTFPRARIAYMLEDSGAGLIVTSGGLRPLADELAQAGLEVLDLDALGPDLSVENPGLAIPPDTYAYLLYTSGSTGQPKGVVESHRNVLHFTMNRTNTCHFRTEDRLSLLKSFCFSGSATPLFGALLNGAALYLRSVKETGVADLADWLIAEEITVSYTGATLFRQFVGTLTGAEAFPKLRLIGVAGEPVYTRDVELYKRHFAQDCLLLNSLGATEMKIFRQYFIDQDTQISGNLVPVGYPLEDVEVLLLDEAGQPVGPGQVGEITVKTRYIAPAYWRRPDLTRAAFRPDPAGGDQRLWRTGDLGRMEPDGCLVHLGRQDFQVKIRGNRVELAEIELALLDLDGIKEAVVIAREDTPGEQRLVAYVVPTDGRVLGTDAPRRHLRARLPDFMVPAAFVFLEALPVNSNGKVDRRALPAPGRARPDLEQAYVAPRGPLETALAAIWADVLKLERVGVEDEFLALGGDSLLATRLLTRVRDALQLELPPAAVFEASTVADQAALLADCLVGRAEGEDLARLLDQVETHPEQPGRARPQRRNQPPGVARRTGDQSTAPVPPLKQPPSVGAQRVGQGRHEDEP